MQHRHGYKWMVTTHESPAAWEEGKQLDQPITLGKPLGVLMLPDTVNNRLEALGILSRQGKRINGTLPDWRYRAIERRAGFRENGKSGSGRG